jgi:hypothetical protein
LFEQPVHQPFAVRGVIVEVGGESPVCYDCVMPVGFRGAENEIALVGKCIEIGDTQEVGTSSA